MKIAITATLSAAIALFSASGSSSAHATDLNDYRWNHRPVTMGPVPRPSYADPSDCREVEIHTTNRWGNDLVIHRRVCN